jgi:thioredoxin 2
MKDKEVFLRCKHCNTINRMPVDKLMDNPKCGKCKELLEISEKPVDGTAENFDQEVLTWPGIVLVEFWAPWCGHCRMIAPVIEELAQERTGLLKVVKINVDNEPSLGMRFNVQATPAFMLYKNGKKLNEVAGALPKRELEEWIDSSSTQDE